MLGAMNDWVYNRNPTQSLHFEGPLKELKEDLASGKKVRARLLRTIHVLRVLRGHMVIAVTCKCE